MISNWDKWHAGLFKEDKTGGRYPMFPENKAIIEVAGDIYTAKTTTGETIAISSEFETIVERVKYAQPKIEIIVKLNGKEMSLEGYLDTFKPVIYRLTFGESERTGFIGVLDYKKNGRYSEIKLFDSIEEIEQYIKDRQKADDFYYIHARRRHRLRINSGGLESFELSKSEKDLSRLSEALKAERARRNKALN